MTNDIMNEKRSIPLKKVFNCSTFQILSKGQDNDWIWHWETNSKDEKENYIFQKARQIETIINSEVSDIHKERCKQHLIGCMATATKQNNIKYKKKIDSIFYKTEKFIKTILKLKIKNIVSIPNKNVRIFMKKNGSMQIHYNKESFSNNMFIVLSEFNRIHALANSSLKRRQRRIINLSLASTLSNALQAPDTPENVEFYLNTMKEIEISTNNRATINAKINVLFFAIIITAFIIFSSIHFYYDTALNISLRNLIIGFASGTLGSLMSIIQRNDQIQVDFSLPFMNVMTQAVSRLILGMVFGIILILLIKSELTNVFNISNNYSLCVLSIIAGFSERFVPDFIDKLSSKSNNNETDTI